MCFGCQGINKAASWKKNINKKLGGFLHSWFANHSSWWLISLCLFLTHTHTRTPTTTHTHTNSHIHTQTHIHTFSLSWASWVAFLFLISFSHCVLNSLGTDNHIRLWKVLWGKITKTASWLQKAQFEKNNGMAGSNEISTSKISFKELSLNLDQESTAESEVP